MYVGFVQYMHPLEIQRQMIERCLFKLYTIHSLHCLSVERDIDKDPNGDTKISPGATLRVSYPRPLVRADRPIPCSQAHSLTAVLTSSKNAA
jgi:hypothetical protein